MSHIWEQLLHPPNEYRTIPFWSWNDKLEIAELERQIEEMHKAGIGGFFMHARGGLQTPYMGEEWMDAIRACIVKGKELGMSPWLYDENGWPSGFADGKVTAKGVAFQQKKLLCEHAPFQSPAQHTIAYYEQTETGYKLLGEEDTEKAQLRLYYEVNPYYLDALSEQAVGAFIEAAYDAYWERFGEEFGDVIQGFFTDEPQFARGQLPWSFELEAAFRSANGYELKEVLPALFLQVESTAKARYDYWACVTAMFTKAYAKQIGDWCQSKGWSFTGHVVDEQALQIQVTSVGDPMAFYEHLNMPGCDWLGRFIGDEPIVPKQVGSVAHQLGKKQTITESFGCSGWDISFADLKRIGEWQFVHGITMICQHLQSYSLKGLRKRDYPPSLFVQQPWWEKYKGFNDYFARLSMLLSEGTRQVEVLLLHPIRSAWTLQRGEDRSDIPRFHAAFAQLSRWMCQAFIEHDYGSESIMEGHGHVKDGQFIIGEAAYRVVVLPPSVTISRTTLTLLKQFVQQDGQLIACAPYPQLVEGMPGSELAELLLHANKPEWSSSAMVDAITKVSAPSIRMTDEREVTIAVDTVNVQTLELEGSRLYYVVNSGDEHYPLVNIELLHKGYVTLIDLTSGDEECLDQIAKADGTRVQLPLHPGQSYMLRLEPRNGHPAKVIEQVSDKSKSESLPTETTILSSYWDVVSLTPNSLTLDTCRLRVDDGEWSELQPVILIQEQLLALGRSVDIELDFPFDVGWETGYNRELFIVMESPELFAIEVNGSKVSSESCGTWRDGSFHKVAISGNVQSGENHIRLNRHFYNSPETYQAIENAKKFESEGNKLTFDTEIESMYLLGEFGVESRSGYVYGERRAVQTEGPFVLTEIPQVVHASELVQQGLPFFAGTIRLRQYIVVNWKDGAAAKWFFPEPPHAAVSKLWLNGHEVRTFLWEPYEADIGRFLVTGENVIEMELTNSCRNLLGPHHHIHGEIYKVGPSSFTHTPGWTDKGIPQGVSMYVDRYTFVRFGLPVPPRIVISSL
ncbi:hypothetical protein PAECIP111891_00052 [Paenibacillus allorhizoplanae]|uniref:Glycoside hydrolase n=1 Tax=Paenibacillus allorhizoplanae TaxID=2905648 RepID=A0ABM9BRV2_9BACL|nr:glycosyl hydrolase [Paenibacillus allorhizoplanae]CAH1191650.1 hypothetical protein PAECIP111891_00052 [Paenibacillus allorhizoplanae]